MIAIEKAREILGKKAENMSDEEVLDITSELETLAHIVIDSYLAEQKKKREQSKDAKGLV